MCKLLRAVLAFTFATACRSFTSFPCLNRRASRSIAFSATPLTSGVENDVALPIVNGNTSYVDATEVITDTNEDISLRENVGSSEEKEEDESEIINVSSEDLVNQDATESSEEEMDTNPFDLIGGRTAACLWESDMRRDAKGEHTKLQASSATNWINDATSFALQKSLDKIKLKVNLRWDVQEYSRITSSSD